MEAPTASGDERDDAATLVASASEELGGSFTALLEDYVRHLRLNRDFSPHTVRAYAGDVAGFLVHLQRLGATALDDASLQSVRSWLAKQASLGLARATLQRRAAAVRMFCRWAHQEGHASSNPAAKLRSPRTVRTLPVTLEPAEAAEMLDRRDRRGGRVRRTCCAARRGDLGTAVRDRDPGLGVGRTRCRRSRPRPGHCARIRQGPQGKKRAGRRSCDSGPGRMARATTIEARHGGLRRRQSSSGAAADESIHGWFAGSFIAL